MKQRVLSGAVLALFCAAIIVFNTSFPPALNIAVALISAVAVYELIKAMGLSGKWYLCLPSMVAAAAVPFTSGNITLAVYAAYTLVIFSAMIINHKEITFKDLGVILSMVIIIPSALGCLVALRDLNPTVGMYYVLVAVFAAWAADIGAYFAGTFFGKHKLCPEISPKKTIEGAVGGLVLNVAAIMLSGLVVTKFMYGGTLSANYLALFIVGFVGSPISILGDLSFSLIKRSCHIKDFGSVIPGHGGILDRFDSVIFTAPFVYLLASVLPLIV